MKTYSGKHMLITVSKAFSGRGECGKLMSNIYNKFTHAKNYFHSYTITHNLQIVYLWEHIIRKLRHNSL